MDRLIYLAMSGAKATMQRQETLANNLANVSTAGFRAELAAFRAVPVEGSGASTRVYSLESTPGYDATPGQVAATGRNLDVAMQGAAWLAVQGLDGTEAYTRGGSLDVNADGNLVTTSGLTVLGDGGPIQIPPDTAVGIAADGTVSVTDINGRSTSVGKLKLVTPEGAADARHRRPVPRRRRRPAGRPAGARAGRRARGLERQRRRDDGRDDRGGAPVRGADEDAADRRRQREGRVAAAVGQLTPMRRPRRLPRIVDRACRRGAPGARECEGDCAQDRPLRFRSCRRQPAREEPWLFRAMRRGEPASTLPARFVNPRTCIRRSHARAPRFPPRCRPGQRRRAGRRPDGAPERQLRRRERRRRRRRIQRLRELERANVDLLAPGYFFNLCQAAGGSTPCVDMEGSGNGAMTTKAAFDLAPGGVTIQFDLAGDQRGHSNNTVTASLVSTVGAVLFSEVFSLAATPTSPPSRGPSRWPMRPVPGSAS